MEFNCSTNLILTNVCRQDCCIIIIVLLNSEDPIIYSNESMYCNNTSQIEMSCTISTELPVYGFGMWTHSFHGTVLRYLKGRVKDNQSILMLTNCSYQDAGDYGCVAWTLFKGKTYNTTKLISVYVNSK